jgi:hypothetical protein
MADLSRGKVCQAISSLSPNCSLYEARRELDPLFLSTPDIDVQYESKITPLIVTCDKGNNSCLEYLMEKLTSNKMLEHFIGHPLDVSSNEDQNTAIHHAAMSGCELSIPILNTLGESILSLASTRNSHGDTPLMMAAANGHLDFLRTFHKLSVQEAGLENVQAILLAKNYSNDSCLSLASCHGHPAVVEFLIGLVPIETELLQTCRLRCERMDSALRSNPELMKQNKSRLDSVRQCVDKLEATLSRHAEETASKLLAEGETLLPKERIKPKKKKKQTRRSNQDLAQPKKDSSTANSSSFDTRDKDDDMRLTTLADGTVAVVVHGEEPERPNLRLPASINMQDPSVKEMFRKRFEGASAKVEAVMDALCLDVSMLLYTPHGMALNLSPSQLDAVQAVLQNQLVFVQEARKIQNRMHGT